MIKVSKNQEDLIVNSLLTADSPAFNNPLVVTVQTTARVGVVAAILRQVISRHPILSMRVISTDNGYYWDAGGQESPIIREITDVNPSQYVREDAGNPIDVLGDRLYRAACLSDDPGTVVACMTVHRVLVDDVGLAWLADELVDALHGEERSRLSPGAGADGSASDERAYAWSAQYEADLNFWKQLHGKRSGLLEPRGITGASGDRVRIRGTLNLESFETSTARSFQPAPPLEDILSVAAFCFVSRMNPDRNMSFGVETRDFGNTGVSNSVGMLSNILPLRLALKDCDDFADVMEAFFEGLGLARSHGRIPYGTVLRDTDFIRGNNGNAYLDVLVSSAPSIDLTGRGHGDGQVVAVDRFSGRVNRHGVEVCLAVDPKGLEVDLAIVGFAEYFPSVEPGRLFDWFRRYWTALIDCPKAPLNSISLMSPAEREQVLYDFNATDIEVPEGKSVEDLFEEQVDAAADAVAVVCDDEEMTYGALNEEANRLARFLSSEGVALGVKVAVCVEPSFELVIALLAIWKAGGAFVPIDIAHPADRLATMLSDAAPSVILCTPTTGPRLLAAGVDAKAWSLIDLHGDAGRWRELDGRNLARTASSRDPARLSYVIYTSGSTGAPKGVAVEQKGVVNLYQWYIDTYIESGDAILVMSSFVFDLTYKNVFAPLLCGARVVLLRSHIVSGREIAWAIEGNGISLINCAPTQFYEVVYAAEEAHGTAGNTSSMMFRTLRNALVGGEPINPDLIRRWYQICGGTTVSNSYGTTEISDVATDGRIDLESTLRKSVPIGRPIANTRIYILDPRMEPVPVGLSGEIYIGGTGVGQGYLNRPDLTAQRFLESPFVPGERLYRTGDIGRYLADGNIEFLGRNDDQVKIRGFRIELGEIEAHMSRLERIREVVVVVREDILGEKWIVAYYTSEGIAPEAADLRSALSSKLPEYMVPAIFVPMDEFPLNSSRKVDRLALPQPAFAQCKGSYEEPRGETEVAVAHIWREVLGVERIGRGDNFFELGGHSLVALRLADKVRDTLRPGDKFEPTAIFTHPTLERFSIYISDLRT